MNNIYKNSIKYLSLSVLLLTALTSCDDDDFNEVPAVAYSPVAVTMSATDNNVTVLETDGEATFTITASIAEPQELDYAIVLEQTSGDATEGEDFDFDHTIIISAGSTSSSADVVIYATGDIENDETFTITAKSADTNIILSPFTFNATISGDYINDVLDLVLSWDGSFSENGVNIDSFCPIDMDLILYDGNGNQIDYIAGTSDCPEVGSVSGLADGMYMIAADLYENPFENYGFNEPIPVKLTYSQDFLMPETTFDYSGGYTLSTPGSDTFGNVLFIATLVVQNGYEYTVTPL
ncbi:hypothetical protein [Bizionia sp.]|uniref:hypothetical protein n=1 Tax=Bizionia sp. TaxID=1954480 RepID=UPI003A8DD66D